MLILFPLGGGAQSSSHPNMQAVLVSEFQRIQKGKTVNIIVQKPGKLTGQG